jgi:hypothetical protein
MVEPKQGINALAGKDDMMHNRPNHRTGIKNDAGVDSGDEKPKGESKRLIRRRGFLIFQFIWPSRSYYNPVLVASSSPSRPEDESSRKRPSEEAALANTGYTVVDSGASKKQAYSAVGGLSAPRASGLSASRDSEYMPSISYQYATALANGGSSFAALTQQQQQNELIQQALRAHSSEQRTGHELLRMLNNQIQSSAPATDDSNVSQSLQLEQDRVQSLLNVISQRQQQINGQREAFALQGFNKQQALRGQDGSSSYSASAAASMLGGDMRNTWSAVLADNRAASAAPAHRQHESSDVRVQELLAQIHAQEAGNNSSVNNIAPSPCVAGFPIQSGSGNLSWLQGFGASRRVGAQDTVGSTILDDMLAQVRGQEAATASNAHQFSRGPMTPPQANLPGALPNDAFLQQLLQQGLQPRFQAQPAIQVDQTSADSAFMARIYGSLATQMNTPQDARERLAALQQWQVQAPPPIAHPTPDNSAWVQSILAQINNAGQLRGPPGPTGANAAKSQEPVTSVPMEAPSDVDQLSKYQVLIRRQLEYFISKKDDADYSVQGRKKQARLDQVGIRCKHCSHLPHRLRGRGAGYYPAKLSGVYQAAQNMATNHLNQFCNSIPPEIREQLRALRGGRHDSAAGGGKQYWADMCQEIGLIEEEDGLRFRSPPVLPPNNRR